MGRIFTQYSADGSTGTAVREEGVSVKYGNIAIGAKENFVAEMGYSEFRNLEVLQQYGVRYKNYTNPCENYQTLLDGNSIPIGQIGKDAGLGVWSGQTSDESKQFYPIQFQPILKLNSEKQYSSSGLTFTFDEFNNAYPTKIEITWSRTINGEKTNLSNKVFYPNKPVYFCENEVEDYNGILIVFYSMNMPKTRLKIFSIEYGEGVFFYGENLRNVKISQEIDPISSQLASNTADFVLDNNKEMGLPFQTKQPLSIYFNKRLLSTTFIKDVKQKSQFLWQIKSEDYIGLMSEVQYYGGMYNKKKAIEVLSDIFNVAKIPFEIDDIFLEETITGYIPFTNCREALMQVVFALGAVVDTSNSDVVKITKLNEEVQQTIPRERIMQGQTFDEELKITSVEITYHSYNAIDETINVYDANENGIGERIFVRFQQPLHSLNITNGEIVESGTNYAIVNANSECILTGKKYEHITQIKRLTDQTTMIERTAAIENATLVNNENVDKLIEKCYNWITRVNSTNLTIIEGKKIIGDDVVRYGQAKYGAIKYGAILPKTVLYDKKISLGDEIITETEYLGDIQGKVIKQSFSLNGGIIAKKCVIK